MIREMLVIHHSHTDVGFTHPQPVWWELSRRFIDEALDLCEMTREYPDEAKMRWTCENTAPLLHWIEHARPAQVDRLTAAIQAGQLSVGALPFNLSVLPDLEQLTRSLQPIQRLRRDFGLPVKTAIAHDVNGIPWPLTQLLLDAGVELLLTGINAHFGGVPLPRPSVFEWVGQDRRSLLSHVGLAYTTFDKVACMDQDSLETMAEGIEEFLRGLPQAYPYAYICLTATHRPWHNDNNPPNPWLPDRIRRWNASGRQPLIRMVTPEQYLARLRAEDSTRIPRYTGDWTEFWSFGVGSAAFEARVAQKTRARLAAVGLARAANRTPEPGDAEQEGRAYDSLNLWAEHTWASDDSLTMPESDNSHEQWAHKLGYLYQARSAAQLLMRDQLERLAGNPLHARGLSGLLVFNPAPVARKEFLRLPARFSLEAGGQPAWNHFSSLVMRLDQYFENAELGKWGTYLGPVEIPANGWTFVPLAELKPAAIDPAVRTGEGWLESTGLRLRYDPATGRVLELFDKVRGWNMADADSPWDFGGLVWEHLAPGQPVQWPHYGREAFFELNRWDKIEADQECWISDWDARRESPSTLLECRAEASPLGATLVRRWQGIGLEEIEERITLLAAEPALTVDVQFRLGDRLAPEAYYLTLPLDLAGWQAHFDTAELPVALNGEQLPGSCRDWQCVTRWVSLDSGERGVTVACPDAPLVQLGGFGWAAHSRTVETTQKALFLGWLTNNYWNCNFPASQPGKVRFHYKLIPHGEYAPGAAMECGLLASSALEVHPVVGQPGAARGQVVRVSGADVVQLYAGLGEDGSVRVRLFNGGAKAAQARLTLPGRGIAAAVRVDTLLAPVERLAIAAGEALVTIPPGAVIQAALTPAD